MFISSFSSACVLLDVIEREGFMGYAAAHHQGGLAMFWLHVLFSVSSVSLWFSAVLNKHKL